MQAYEELSTQAAARKSEVCRFLDGWSPELNVEGGLFQEGTYTFNVLVWRADETEADGSNASITVTLSSSAPPPVVITTPWLNGSGVSMQRGFSGSVEAEIRGSASCPVPEVQNFRWALVDSQERVLTMYDPQGFWNGTYSLLGLSQFPGELLTKGQLYEYVLVMASDSTFVAMQGGLIASLASATASGAFVVHSAPFLADGDPSCTAAAEPIQGFAVQTKFKLSATNVVDERVAELQYVFYQFPLAQLAALAADLGTAVTALEWSNYSSDSYWVSQGGVMLQDWSKASVVDSVLPVGDFVTVLRIRDYLGAVALAYLAGPNISAPTGGVDIATAAAALNSAVALNSANGILNTVDAVSSVDVNGTEEEINAVVGASMSALETASQLVAPDASTLQKVGNVLARTLSRGTSSTRDKAMLSRASEVVDTVLTTALQGSAQAISTDAGNAIMSGLVAITSANGEGTASASESAAVAARETQGPLDKRSHAAMAARLLLLSWLGLAAGQATAGLLLRPKELQKIKGSLGRISDEVHSILGVLEESNVGIEAAEEGGLLGTLQGLSEQVERRWIAPAKAPPLNQSFADASAPSAPSARWAQLRELGLRWWQRALHWGEKMMWFGLFVLDVSVVIAMMLFLESLGRPRRKSRAAPLGTLWGHGAA
ncbi:unnamed protein product [Effrenium voratum]|nr:unnamed protein product [Effrenium voratum]